MGKSSKRGSTQGAIVEMEDFGVVVQVHNRGFGFACCLTGDQNREIFLNENRISFLKSINSQLLGRLIRMRVVRQLDGRLSATSVRPLAPTDAGTIELARQHLARREASLDADVGPAPILRLLAGISPAIDRLLHPMIDAVTEAEWLSPAMLDALTLAPQPVWKHAISHHLNARTPGAVETLFDQIKDSKKKIDITWLKPMWESLPAHRDQLQRIAFENRMQMSVSEAAQWARLALENHPQTGTDWWDVLRDSIESGLPLDSHWLHWEKWTDAPWKTVAIALQKCDADPGNSIARLIYIANQSHEVGRMDATLVLASLNHNDQRLSDMWIPQLGIDTPEDIAHALSAQMMTARAAEKCAATYINGLGLPTEDIALHQLDGSTTAWQQMDLRVDGKHGMDVKNVRRNINGGIQSSRWKVKGFKSDAAGNEVTLCGVSSPYTWKAGGGLRCKTSEYMRVLGVTKSIEISQLLEQFKDIFTLRTNPASRLIELPAWAWDYPKAQYRERDQAMAVLRDALSSLYKTAVGRRCITAIPPVFFSFWGMEPPGSDRLTTQQRDFLDLLRSSRWNRIAARQEVCAPRLPWLYLFILHAWARWRAASELADTKSILSILRWHAHSTQDAMHAASLARIARAKDLKNTDPPMLQTDTVSNQPSAVSGIGIIDPANMIETLLNALSILEKHVSRSQFITLSDITIHYNGILVGTFPDGQRKTLLAHCGGRLEEKNVECGHRPLVYGKQKTCTCGRLICEKCGSCADPRYESCADQTERHARLRLKKKVLRR